MKHSQLDLISKEITELQTQQKWHKRLINDYKKQKDVRLSVSIPLELYLRKQSLLGHLDKEYDYELNETFIVLVKDILYQYGNLIDPQQLYDGLMDMQGKVIQNYNRDPEFVLEYDYSKDLTVVTISLPYRDILALEWICDDIMKFAKVSSHLMIEDILRITFTNFALDARSGKMPDLSKKMRHFVDGELA